MIIREKYLNKLLKFRKNNLIKVITGVRRCGKTTLLKQLISKLQEEGIPENNILFYSFESKKLKK